MHREFQSISGSLSGQRSTHRGTISAEVIVTGYEQRRYEMLRRVVDWGAAHSLLFTGASMASEMFAAVGTAIDTIDRCHADKRRVRQHHWRDKRVAREALVARLNVIARTAEDMATRRDDADARFPRLSRRSDTSILMRGRLFEQECQAARNEFLAHGMPASFIDDLRQLIAAFEEHTWHGWSRRSTVKVARTLIESAFVDGSAAVRSLDVIVSNALRHDPAALAGWKAVRRVDRLRSSRTAA